VENKSGMPIKCLRFDNYGAEYVSGDLKVTWIKILSHGGY